MIQFSRPTPAVFTVLFSHGGVGDGTTGWPHDDQVSFSFAIIFVIHVASTLLKHFKQT
uniref:Uncharacterized protein n=1 Tax=Anguilla anguilla TaxID=7936 RepID=A0A0E9UWS6_ANGAN